jgi:ribosomal protein S18 acetylase RimI-like enzyme
VGQCSGMSPDHLVALAKQASIAVSDDRAVHGVPGITVRAWEPRDRSDVQALLRLLSEDAEVTARDAPTYVAEKDGQVVGIVTLCVFTTLIGAKAYLDHLVVAPRWRRRGVGRALMQHAIERAEAAGASRIDLTANATKEAGHALYRSLGFQQRETSNFRLSLLRKR